MGFGGSPGGTDWPNSYENAVVQVLAGLFGNQAISGHGYVYEWDGKGIEVGPASGESALGDGLLGNAFDQANPYDTYSYFDPKTALDFSDEEIEDGSPLGRVDDKLSTLETTAALDPNGDWESAFEAAWYRLKGTDVDGTYTDLFADPDIDTVVSTIATAAVADFATVLNTSSFRTDCSSLVGLVDSTTELAMSVEVADEAMKQAIQYAAQAIVSFPLQNFIRAIESKTLPAHYRQLNRFNAGMADINAVQTSTFVQANQMHWAMFQQNINESMVDFTRQLYTTVATQFSQIVQQVFQSEMQNQYGVVSSSFNAQLASYAQVFGSKVGQHLDGYIKARLQTNSDAHAIIRESIQGQLKHQQVKGQLQHADASLELEFSKVLMMALNSRAQDVVEHEIRRITWDFALLKTGFDALGAPMGAVSVPPKEGWGSKLVGGAASGAASVLAGKVG